MKTREREARPFSLTDWLEACDVFDEQLERAQVEQFLLSRAPEVHARFRQLAEPRMKRQRATNRAETWRRYRAWKETAFGDVARQLIPTVASWLNDDRPDVQLLAARVIGRTRLECAVEPAAPRLFELAESTDGPLRAAAVDALIALPQNDLPCDRDRLASAVAAACVDMAWDDDFFDAAVQMCQELADKRDQFPEIDRILAENQQLEEEHARAVRRRLAEQRSTDVGPQAPVPPFYDSSRTELQLARYISAFRRDLIHPLDLWCAVLGSLKSSAVPAFMDRLDPRDQDFLIGQYGRATWYHFERTRRPQCPPNVRATVEALSSWFERRLNGVRVVWRRFRLTGTEGLRTSAAILVYSRSEHDLLVLPPVLEDVYPVIDLSNPRIDQTCYWHCRSCQTLIAAAPLAPQQCQCGNLTVDSADNKLVTRDDPISVRLVRLRPAEGR